MYEIKTKGKRVMETNVLNMASYLNSMETRKKVCDKNMGLKAAVGGIGMAVSAMADSLVCKADTKYFKSNDNDDGGVGDYIEKLDQGKVVDDKDKKLSKATDTAVGISAEVYMAMRTVGLILCLVCLIWSIIKLAGSSGRSQDEAKSGIGKGVIAIIALGSLAGFVTFAFQIGSDLFK